MNFWKKKSFSISNLLIYLTFFDNSYWSCAILLNCWTDGGNCVPSFLGLPFGLISIPAASFRWFLLCLWKNSFIWSLLKPNFFAISFCVNPCCFNSNISFSYSFICPYFLDIKIPPMVIYFGSMSIVGVKVKMKNVWEQLPTGGCLCVIVVLVRKNM